MGLVTIFVMLVDLLAPVWEPCTDEWPCWCEQDELDSIGANKRPCLAVLLRACVCFDSMPGATIERLSLPRHARAGHETDGGMAASGSGKGKAFFRCGWGPPTWAEATALPGFPEPGSKHWRSTREWLMPLPSARRLPGCWDPLCCSL
mmetsp:Transcript_105397/g.225107  ORF Transcript_105397/g.225107 Transcript_105397/m.225107 type:complete len:148 (-) Transcript_105397:751-1194(-)